MEMQDYGYPPAFPEDVQISKPLSEESEISLKDKSKGKKVNAVFKEVFVSKQIDTAMCLLCYKIGCLFKN